LAKASHEPNNRRIKKTGRSGKGSIWRPFKHLEPANDSKYSTQLIPPRKISHGRA
jgi:hypothetical protein